MTLRRPIGSDRAPSPAVGTRSSGALPVRRNAPVPPNAKQAQERRGPDRPVAHDRNQPDAQTPLLENGIAGGRPRRGRPGFARLQASIAAAPMEWACQYPPSVVTDPKGRAASAAKLLSAGLSASAPWLGGVAAGLVAAGVIAIVATVQSGRPPPAGEAPSPEPVTALAGPAEGLVSAAPGRERGATDPTAAPDGSAPAVEIALLGPVLASAGEAEQVSARMPARTARVWPAAADAHLLHEPPRPAFRPTLVSAADGDRPALRP
jgi:hypothetical protein